MCSNQAIVDTVECYMDDLVERFDDFVKKSLIIISIGIGIFIAMLMYLLKVVSNRTPISNIIAEDTASAHNQIKNMALQNNVLKERAVKNKIEKRKLQDNKIHAGKETNQVNTTTGVNTVSGLAPKPSFDEKVLRDDGLSSCSKPERCNSTSSHTSIPRRVPMPSSSLPKRKSVHSIRPTKNYTPCLEICSKHVPNPDSCCSMCCNNE